MSAHAVYPRSLTPPPTITVLYSHVTTPTSTRKALIWSVIPVLSFFMGVFFCFPASFSLFGPASITGRCPGALTPGDSRVRALTRGVTPCLREPRSRGKGACKQDSQHGISFPGAILDTGYPWPPAGTARPGHNLGPFRQVGLDYYGQVHIPVQFVHRFRGKSSTHSD